MNAALDSVEASSGPAALVPRGHGLLLRAPQMSDFLQWAQLRELSRGYLTPWEPIWPSDDLTRSGFRRRLRRYSEDLRSDPEFARYRHQIWTLLRDEVNRGKAAQLNRGFDRARARVARGRVVERGAAPERGERAGRGGRPPPGRGR